MTTISQVNLATRAPHASQWCALGLAVAATGTAVCVSVLAGWQRGGWLSERLLWIAIAAVLVITAHLLPALCRSAPPALRIIGAVLWIGCTLATCYGHATFFLSAQMHAGELRADVVTVPPTAAPTERDRAAIAADRASAVAELTARCTIGCAAKREVLRARIDALDAEAAEAQRREAQADRLEAQQDHAEARRDALRADPVTTRVAILLGVPVTRIDLLTGLAFAAVLEGVACFCWLVAFEPKGAIGQQAASPMPDQTTPLNPAVTDTVTAPVAVAVPPCGRPHDEVAQVFEAISAGRLRGTVAEIRKHLGCSQSRAVAVRRQLASAMSGGADLFTE